jgi:hypothetical protein
MLLRSYTKERKPKVMKRSVWVPVGLLLFIVCFFTWLVAAMDYGDSVAVGKYSYERSGESSTLVLNPDHTFRQTRRFGSNEQHSEGTWRRVGQGGISFSKEFLVVAGDEPEPDGTTFSDMKKILGVFVTIRLRQFHVLWYGKTGSDAYLPGIYKGDEPGVTATLVLNADHSFIQEIEQRGITHHATGTWSQDSNGTVQFSRAFLKTSGEPLREDETASSIDPQGSNLQIEISMANHIPEPVFHKRPTFW